MIRSAHQLGTLDDLETILSSPQAHTRRHIEEGAIIRISTQLFR